MIWNKISFTFIKKNMASKMWTAYLILINTADNQIEPIKNQNLDYSPFFINLWDRLSCGYNVKIVEQI